MKPMANFMKKYMIQTQCLQIKTANNTAVKYLRKAFALSAIFFALIVLISSCKKPSEEIGLEVQPAEDQLGILVTDTFSIISYVKPDDSIRTSNLSTGIAMLGSYNDPTFGISRAGIFTQVLLSTSNVDFAPSGGTINDIVVDSLVLSLVFDETGYYGDFYDQRLKVHRVTNDFYSNIDSVYYTTDTISYDPFVNLTKEEPSLWIPAPHDSVMVAGVMEKPQLRIQLDKNLGYEIINQSGNAVLASNDQATGFLSLLKGLYITTDNGIQPIGRGGIFYFDMLHPDTKLTLYYHAGVIPDSHEDGGWPIGTQSLEYDFSITSDAATFTHVEHDYTATPIAAQLSDSTFGQQNIYVQAGGGVRSIIHVPDLMNLVDSGMIGINKAEFIIPIADATTANYSAIDRMAMQYIKDNGQEGLIEDELMLSDLNIDGYYNSADNTYRLLVTRHIIKILKGEVNNNGFLLLATGAGITVNRTELVGPENATNPLKLVVYYTKYNQ